MQNATNSQNDPNTITTRLVQAKFLLLFRVDTYPYKGPLTGVEYFGRIYRQK